jgi:hypothetical protein
MHPQLTGLTGLTAFSQPDDASHRWLMAQRYAIVDAAMRDDLPADWPGQVLAPAFLGDDTERCPLLLDVQALTPAQQDRWCELVLDRVAQGEEPLCSLLLGCDAEPKVLHRHLLSRIAVAWPGEDQAKHFRFYDPNTLAQLPDALQASGMAWLLGPMQAVGLAWNGQWWTLPASEAKAQRTLHDTQRAALLRIGTVNRIAGAMPAVKDLPEWITRCRQVSEQVQRAQAHGLSALPDVLAFVRQLNEIHPHIDSHPRWQALLQTLHAAAPEDELDYPSVCGNITEQEWARMAQELQIQEGTTP